MPWRCKTSKFWWEIKSYITDTVAPFLPRNLGYYWCCKVARGWNPRSSMRRVHLNVTAHAHIMHKTFSWNSWTSKKKGWLLPTSPLSESDNQIGISFLEPLSNGSCILYGWTLPGVSWINFLCMAMQIQLLYWNVNCKQYDHDLPLGDGSTNMMGSCEV